MADGFSVSGVGEVPEPPLGDEVGVAGGEVVDADRRRAAESIVTRMLALGFELEPEPPGRINVRHYGIDQPPRSMVSALCDELRAVKMEALALLTSPWEPATARRDRDAVFAWASHATPPGCWEKLLESGRGHHLSNLNQTLDAIARAFEQEDPVDLAVALDLFKAAVMRAVADFEATPR